MKFLDIIKSASSNLLRNKGRTILTIIAILIGAFTISLTTGVNIGINDYIDKQIGGLGGENQLVIQAKMDINPIAKDKPQKYNPDKKVSTISQFQTLNDKDLKKIEKIKGIKKVEAFQNVSTAYIEGKNTEKYVFSASQSLGTLTIDLEEGKPLNNDSSEYEINLAPEFVKSLGFSSSKDAVGKMVKIAAKSQSSEKETIVEAKIVGVRNVSLVQGGMSLVNQALVDKLVTINQEGLPDTLKGQYSGAVAVVEKEDSSLKKEIARIKKELNKFGYEGRTTDDQIGMIRNVINAITGVLTMFGAIALLAASFGIINTLYMSVQERTREIGLMKAMGLGSGKVFTLFSIEAALIGFFGSLLGILLSIGASSIINKVATDSFLKGMTGITLIQYDPQSFVVITLIIMFIAFLAGTLPARRAAKLDPIDSLRYE